MTTTSEETARHLANMRSITATEDPEFEGRKAADYFSALSSELAATKSVVATLEQLVRETHEGETVAIQRAEAAESRLGEIEKELEWMWSEQRKGVADIGERGSYVKPVDGTGPSIASALIEAWRGGKASECASCPRTDNTSEDDDSDIVIAGRQVPFVQVGMIVHPDDCLNCERDGNPLWCSALVCDIYDDDEAARFGMMATLLFRNGERREEPCDELRRRWRMARDFDQTRVYTGRWGAIPRGSVWPVAEVNEDA